MAAPGPDRARHESWLARVASYLKGASGGFAENRGAQPNASFWPRGTAVVQLQLFTLSFIAALAQ
ncbi:MAG TPA: hypothetical protein VGD54_04865 [Steroidobacteraceae bacterium]